MTEIHDCGGDAAAYVLGALEPAEVEPFERHLESCVVCRDEVAALGRVVQALPLSAPQYPMPGRVRRRVLRAVRADARKGSEWRARHRPGWAWRAAALGGSCAALAAAVLIATNLSSGAGVRVIQARVTGISGSASVRLSAGRGELIVRHLSPPPSGKIYELWLKRGASAPAPTRVLFSVTSRGAGDIGLPSALHGVTEILVTPEPKGGSPHPTHAPVIVAPLT